MSVTKKEKPHPYGSDISKFIDQTLLKPQATEADVIKLCKGAIKYNFHSVCVNPYYVPLCKAILTGHYSRVTTVIGFPLGLSLKEVKVYEAVQSVLYGAHELDIVMNMGAAKSANWKFVEQELSDIIAASGEVLHKVIIETCFLTEKEKMIAAEVVLACGAKFIKTSSGYGSSGAKIKDVKLLKGIVGDKAEIKAAGGIKTLKQALGFLKAGAARIGTSSGVEIVKEAMNKDLN